MLTVVVAVYNVDKWLSACMDCLLQQTYSDMEIILVDDGSKDQSGLMCDAYAAQYPAVRVIHQANMGLSGARNTGIALAKGDFIAFVDPDDLVAADYFGMMLRAMEENACDAAVCAFDRFMDGQEGSLEAHPAGSIRKLTTDRLFLEGYTGLIRHGDLTSACNKVFRRELLGDLRFPIGLINEDEHTVYRWLMNCAQVAYLSAKLYRYRQRAGSIMHEQYTEKRLPLLDALRDKADRLGRRYGDTMYMYAFYNYLELCVQHAFEARDAKSALEKDIRRRFVRDYPLYKGPWDRRRVKIAFYRYAPRLYRTVLKLRKG